MLACGSAALNHYQERNTDALMARTAGRPIPSGKISSINGILISLFFLASGSLILLFKSNLTALAIGLYTFAWYNAVYTPLKRMTPFAIIPGSLVGALPPVAGWAAAGADIADPKIIFVALFFFVWQIPHFWILLMVYGKDYDRGGFPNLTNLFSVSQLKKITFSWIMLTSAIAMTFNIFEIPNYTLTGLMLICVSVWLIFESVKFLKSEDTIGNCKSMFIRINIFSVLIITILSTDKLIKLFLA